MALFKDGFRTLVSFSLNVNFFLVVTEKTLTPPGLDARGPIDITTMRTTRFIQKWPKQLVDLTEFTFVGAYDKDAYAAAMAMLGQIQFITITFPDGRAIGFYGFLDKFLPQEHREGEQPTATVTVIPSNINPLSVELGPTL